MKLLLVLLVSLPFIAVHAYAPLNKTNPNGCDQCVKGACGSVCCPGGGLNCPCCSDPGPPPAPPSKCAGLGTDACYTTPNCGWCVDDQYNNGCFAGDMAGPFTLTPDVANCDNQWTPGRYRAAGSMCVMVLSELDVRCYQQCDYGQSIAETFIVPSQAACDTYDSAYKSIGCDGDDRQEVQSYITSYVLYAAVQEAEKILKLRRARNASVPNDMTRQLISDGLNDLEEKGLDYLEDGACDYFTDDMFDFCQWSFTKDVESYVNDKVLSIPLIQNANNWMIDTADEYVPSGVRNVVDDVADVYNAGQDVWDACESAGEDVIGGLFGW